MRYDLDVPRTERFDRYSFFDFTATSPIADRVPTNEFFTKAALIGAIRYVDADNRRQVPTDKNNWGPRFGFAYNLDNRTVVRGAYGIYYAPSGFQAAGHTGSSGMIGYRASSNMVVSLDGRTPIAFLDNPFPSGFNLPTGNSLGAATNIGLGIGVADRARGDRGAAHRGGHVDHGQRFGHDPILPPGLTYIKKVAS